MNMQAMLKQAQSIQKEMMKAKEEVDNTEFVGESSLVKVTMKGSKEVTKVEINAPEGIESDDVEMLQDMIMVAVNAAVDKIDETLDSKMEKFGNIPGLF